MPAAERPDVRDHAAAARREFAAAGRAGVWMSAVLWALLWALLGAALAVLCMVAFQAPRTGASPWAAEMSPPSGAGPWLEPAGVARLAGALLGGALGGALWGASVGRHLDARTDLRHAAAAGAARRLGAGKGAAAALWVLMVFVLTTPGMAINLFFGLLYFFPVVALLAAAWAACGALAGALIGWATARAGRAAAERMRP